MAKARVTLELGVEAESHHSRTYLDEWRTNRGKNDVLVLSSPYWRGANAAGTTLPEGVKALLHAGRQAAFAGKGCVHAEPDWISAHRRKTGEPVFGMHALAEENPFADGTLHHVVAKNLFGWLRFGNSVNTVKRALAETHRALAPGGELVIDEDITPYVANWSLIERSLKARGYNVGFPEVNNGYRLAARKPRGA